MNTVAYPVNDVSIALITSVLFGTGLLAYFHFEDKQVNNQSTSN